jgi:hypothetical protein
MFEITAKLGNMRKAVEWTVYPGGDNAERIIIQSDHRIAAFDKTTGEGVLSRSTTNPGFAHLNPFLRPEKVTVPKEVIDACIAAQPHKGQHIGGGVFIG